MNIAVNGIGRTGGEVIREILKNDQYNLAAAFCSDNSAKAGEDIGTLLHIPKVGIYASEVSQADDIFKKGDVDVFIDFSNPSSTKALLLSCQKYKVPGVICTTGFSKEELSWMSGFVTKNGMGVVFAPNVTLGVNVLIAALKVIARALPDFDYRITETHHSKKMDRPSGTAKIIARTLEDELEMAPDKHIPIHSIRAGGYVGLHEVLLVSDCERLSIAHESFSRKTFVQGALFAAKFILGKTGWYTMEDVVDVHSLLDNAKDAV